MTKAKLTQGPIGSTLVRMTIPMVFGIASMMLFNIIDTYWVSKLGNLELAAISFTFPAAYSTICLAIGIGVGASAILAKVIGEGEVDRVRRLLSQTLILGCLLAVAVGVLGIATHDALFLWMGAQPDMLPLIQDYMLLWYGGLPILMMPIICNGALRASGDARTPGMVMGIAALFNLVLDPILIFGMFGCPAMGVRGAAVATLMSWFVSLVVALRALANKELLSSWKCSMGEMLATWKKVLYIGLPAAFTNILTPLSAFVITKMVAGHGLEAVAGFGVVSRVEPIALVVVIALTTVLGPFIGQNWGAGLHGRVSEALRVSLLFAVAFEIGLLPLLLGASYSIAAAFSQDQQTIQTVIDFLWIQPFSYGFVGVTLVVSTVYNALHKPMVATGINLLRLLVFLIPLAYFGDQGWGLKGIFIGVAVANVLSGIIAYVALRRTMSCATVT